MRHPKSKHNNHSDIDAKIGLTYKPLNIIDDEWNDLHARLWCCSDGLLGYVKFHPMRWATKGGEDIGGRSVERYDM